MYGWENNLPHNQEITRFTFTTEEMELLSFFEEASSLNNTAKSFGRDVTIVSRMLKRISEKSPVLEKISGRWHLTEQGKQLCALTRDTIKAQKALLNERKNLRVGTNREFLQKVLLPDYSILKNKLPQTEFMFRSYEAGTEKALLEGQIDIAIDCGSPYSPEVSFKTCVRESMILCCHIDFYNKHKAQFKKSLFEEIPHIRYDRMRIDKYYPHIKTAQTALHFSDIVNARDACLLGYGWTLLPVYMIQDALKKKSIVQLSPQTASEKYGVWWLKRRPSLANESQHFIHWLSQKDLG